MRAMENHIDRFMRKVNKSGPIPAKTELGNCWTWDGPKDRFGYGRFKTGRTNNQAHRWIAAREAGVRLRWDSEMRQTVNHRCGNRSCVRPEHLYIGDQKSNVADAVADQTHHSVEEKSLANARAGCVNGHEFTPENTYVSKSNQRVCRKCQAIGQARYRQKQKALGVAWNESLGSR